MKAAKPKPLSEHQIQCEVVRWFDLQYRNEAYSKRLVATPNGGHRHITVASKMKAEGQRAGFPDLFLHVPREGFHGLAIEMKTKVGKVSPAQDDWMTFLASQGYAVSVCRSFDDARNVIEEYLRA